MQILKNGIWFISQNWVIFRIYQVIARDCWPGEISLPFIFIEHCEMQLMN